jgi:hypothetical protein
MAIYCGVDLHARQPTGCYCDTADGEIHLKELDHQEDVRVLLQDSFETERGARRTKLTLSSRTSFQRTLPVLTHFCNGTK